MSTTTTTDPTDPTDPRPTTTVTNDQGVTFHARLIRTGDRYGLVDKLTNDGAAMVEFFDAEADPAKFGPLGQFVSRYYVDTFNETAEDGRGIALEGSVPRWTITAANVAEVAAWLASLDPRLVRYVYVETTNEEGRHNESIGPFPTAEDATAFLPLALADPSWSIIDAEVRADYEAPLVAHWVHEWPAWIAERSNEWGGDAPEWSLALLAWQDEHPDMWAKVEAAAPAPGTVTLSVTLTVDGDPDEMAELFRQYLTSAEGPFLADYGRTDPARAGDTPGGRADGYEGPFVIGVEVATR